MSQSRIRRAVPGDAAAIAHSHVAGWQVAYRGILPEAYLDALNEAENAVRRRKILEQSPAPSSANWVLERAGVLLGWAATCPARDEDLGPGVHELAAIYLDPERIGQGHGRELMAFCIADAVEQGCGEMIMWVLSGNERANRFYEAAGFVPDLRTRELPFRDTGALKRRLVRSIGPG